jgi:hypothetical protein
MLPTTTISKGREFVLFNSSIKSFFRSIYSSFKKNFLSLLLSVVALFSWNGSWGQITVSSTGGNNAGNGTYETLAAAFTAMGGATPTATGIITITVSGNTTEPPAGAILGAGTWTSITIAPSGGPWTISGAIAAKPLIDFVGSDNITINGGGNLIFSNTSTSSLSGTSTLKLSGDATNNTFNNLTILGSATTPLNTNGGNVWISTGATGGNGNDGNSFQNCKFGPAGTNLPTILLLGNGSPTTNAIQNSNVTVNNCEFYDFFNAGKASAAIYMLTGNTGWTVTNNKIYQTATRTITTTQTDYGIYMVNQGSTALGENFTVSGNTIGYNNNAGTGTMTYAAGTTVGGFVGIQLAYTGTTTTTNTISNNIISNIQWTSTGGSIFSGIRTTSITSTTTNAIHSVISNTVANISLISSTGELNALHIGYAPTTNINSNTITGISRTGSGAMYGIRYTGTSSTTVNINANSISNLSFSNTTSTTSFYAIYSVSSPANENITNNSINNLSSTSTAAQSIGGINNSTSNSGTKNFQNNTISSISLSSSGLGTIYGIYKPYGGTLDNISDNNINSITGGTKIYGLYVTAGTVNNLYKNKIYNLSSSVANPTVNAIYSTGSNNNIYNNLIGGISTPAANAANPIIGINISGGTTVNVYFNTISISGLSSTGALFGASGIFVSTSTTVSLRNNIVSISGTANGAGNIAAYRRSTNSLTTYGTLSNNNLFYAGTPSASNLIYVENTSPYTNPMQTLTAYKTFMSNRDQASISENPNFVSTTGSSTNFLHVNTTIATGIESGGAAISGFTTDFDGETRNATTPDIGADEFTGTPLPLCAGTPASSSISGVSSICAGSSASLSLSTTYTDLGLTYQWQSSTTSGGTYSNLGTTSGQATGNLSATTYYICTITCTNSGLSFSTSEFALQVIQLPTVSVSGAAIYCSGSAIPLTSSGASTYTWSPVTALYTDAAATTAYVSGTSASTVYAQPTVTTTYTITGTQSGCSAQATKVVAKGVPITMGSVTAAAPSACAGGTVQVNGSATVPFTPNNYSFNVSSGTYTPITGTNLPSTSLGDDVGTGNLPIGFNFPYNGSSFNVFGMSSNGLILLGNTSTSITGYSGNALASTANVIAGLWDDNNTTGGTMSYVLSGTSPNQTLTIQWTNMHVAGGGSPTNPTISMQVMLFENGQINLIYGPNSATLSSPTASIGLSGASGTYLSVSPNSTISSSTVSSTAENTSVSLTIPSGTIFTFTPPSLTYSWSFTNTTNSLSSTSISNPVATVNATDTYTLTATGSDGCTANGNVTISLGGGSPVVAISTTNSSICTGLSTNLTSSITGGCSPFTYSWSDGTTVVSTSPTYTASPTTTTTYSLTVTDNNGSTGSSTQVITVNPLPVVSVNSANYCTSSTPVVLTASGASTYSWSPSTGLSASSGTSVNANSSTTTSYIVTGTDINGCVATATSTVTVTQTPSAISMSQTPAQACAGSVATLSSSGGSILNSYTIGTGTVQNSSSSSYSAFNGYRASQWSQTIYTAAELLAAGIQPGLLKSLAYNISTQGSSISNNITVKIGNTSLSTVGTAMVSTSSFTTVYSANYTHTSSGWQVIPFSTNFVWDGVSNIVIDVWQDGPDASANPLTYMTTLTSYRALFTYNVSYTATGGTAGTQIYDRMNIQLSNEIPTTLAWSPTTNLFTDALATSAYNGSSIGTVYAQNTSAQTYTLTATNGTCSSSANITTIINELPTITLGSTTPVCAGGTSSTLSYSSSTGTPTLYAIDYDAAANTAGFLDISTYTTLTPSSIALLVPANAGAGTYNATITVKNANGCISAPYSFTITVNAPVAISSQPINTVVLPNATANFSVTASGSGLTYQWEESTNNGSTWSPIMDGGIYTGATTATLTLTGVDLAQNANQYRVIVNGTAPCSSLTSSVGILTVSSTAINAHPQNEIVCTSNGTASFTISTTGSTPTYQWQESMDNGSSWSPIFDGGLYAGSATSTLSLSNLTTTQNAYKYRCVLNGNITSNVALLTVYGAPTITGQPSNITVCSNSTTGSFSVVATGSNLTYQWQLSTDGGLNWSAVSGATSSTYTMTTFTNAMDGYQYRVIVSGSAPCTAATSDAATLSVQGVTFAASTNALCIGASATLTATPTLSASAATYSMICATTGSGLTSASTSSTTTFTPTSTGSFTYTLTTSVGTCSISNTATITVNALPIISSVTASPNTVCNGGTVNLTAASYSAPQAETSGWSGTGNSTSFSSSYPTPFGNYWYEDWNQFLYTAQQLTAMGLVAGELTDIKFKLGALPNPTSISNYSISIGHTTNTSLSTFVTTGLTTVFSSPSYTPTMNTNNVSTVTFDPLSTFIWDGVSNLIIDIRGTGAFGSANATCQYTQTTNNSVVYAYTSTSNPNFWTSPPTATTSTSLPNIRLSGQITQNNTASLTWSWNSTPTATGSNATTIASNTTSSAAPQTYTATATNTAGCVASMTTTPITINPLIAAPTATNSSQCGIGIPTGTIASNSGLTNPVLNWYDASNNLIQSSSLTNPATAYSNSISTTTIYNVSESYGGCSSALTPITFTVVSPPSLNGVTASSNTICAGSSTTLSVSSNNLDYTYSWNNGGGLGSSVTVSPTNTTNYTVTAVDNSGGSYNGCSTTGSISIAVDQPSVAGTATAASGVCGSGTTAIALTGNTGNVQWQISTNNIDFTDIPSATSNTLNTGNISSETYYRANVTNGICPSTLSNVATVYINNPLVLTTTPASVCGTATTAISATGSAGSTLNWYASATGGSSLGSGLSYTTPSLTANTTYYVDATLGNGYSTSSVLQSVTPSSSLTTSSTDGGIVFTTSQANIGITSAKIFVSGSGNMTFQLQNASGTAIASTIIAVSNATTSALYDINFPTTFVTGAAGSGYRLICTAKDASITWYYQSGTYPLNASNGALSITSGYGWSTTYAEIRCIFGISFNVIQNCTSTRTPVTVTYTVAPTVTAAASASPICVGASTNLTATSDNPGYAYAWSNNAGTGATVSVSPITTTTYTVTATDASTSCSNVATVVVTVNPVPSSMTATSSANTICVGSSVNLSSTNILTETVLMNENFANGFPATWTRTTQNAITPWEAAPSELSLSNIGTTINTTTASNGFLIANSDYYGGYYSWWFDEYYTYGPETSTMVTSSVNCSMYSSVKFIMSHYYRDDSNSSADLEVSIDNGTTWQLVNTWNATTTNPSNYEVLVPSAIGQSNVKFRFKYASNYSWYWAIDDVQIIGTSSMPVSWQSTPTGFSSTLQNPTNVSPAVTTTYTVTATNIYNCTSSGSVTVTVNPLPTVTASANQTVCAGNAANITASGASTYAWNNGAGTSETISVTPTSTTTYTVTGTDGNGCTNTAQSTVTVNPVTTITTQSTASQSVCLNNPFSAMSVIASGTGSLSYQWYSNTLASNTGGTLLVGETNATYTPSSSSSGTSYYYCVVSGSCGTAISPVSGAMIVNTFPTVTATSNATNNAICAGSSVILTGNGASTYSWNNSVSNNVAFTPSATTTYTVTGTENGCSNTATIEVVVNTLPSVTASSNVTNNTICSGSTVTLTGGGATTYTWDNGVSNAISFTPSATTTYTVTGTDVNGCVSTGTIEVVVNQAVVPTFNAVAAICANEMLEALPTTSINSISGSWLPALDNTTTTTYTFTPAAGSCASSTTMQIVVNNCNATLNITAFVQGYYDDVLGEMRTPLYTSGETSNENEVDYLTVELHSTTSTVGTPVIIETYTGILNKDGIISCNFPGTVVGNSYYIVIYTPNTIKTWSANPVQINATTSYNFSTSSSQAYGDNMIEMPDGAWAIYSGDINQDGLDYVDYTLWQTDFDNFGSGYLPSDFDGDASIGYTDYVIWQTNFDNFITGEVGP